MAPAALLLAAALAAAPANGDVTPTADWPQWRGPNRDGKALETGITHAWPDGGPKLLWSVKSLDAVGTGYGTPAVVGDRMYLLGGEEESERANEFCTCLDIADGSRVWKTTLPTAPGRFSAGWGRGPRSTPTVDSDRIYVLGTTGDLVCLQTSDGKQVWHTNLVKDFKGQIPNWGYSESVLVDGENVVCTPGKGTAMVALNKKTGHTVWECKEVADTDAYSSIVPTEVGGVRQYVQHFTWEIPNQKPGRAIGVRAKDGKLLWQVGEIGRRTATIPTPVVADGYAFFTAGYGAGCECYRLEPDGDGTKAVKVYTKFRTVSNHHGGVIAVGDHVYGHSDRGGWICFAFKEAEDEAVWQSQKLGKGSIAYADGHFYCYSEGDGTLARVKASTSGWEEAGRFKIPATSPTRPRSGRVWPHPVIAQGKLFLRDYEYLYCYDLKGN